jgi:hypothetical protein
MNLSLCLGALTDCRWAVNVPAMSADDQPRVTVSGNSVTAIGETYPNRQPAQENLWLNLVFNGVIPALLLTFASKDAALGPVWGLVVALVFPLGYGLWSFIRLRSWNLFSVLGCSSVLLTGGLGLLRVDGIWFAVKEAALPTLLGFAVPLSMRTRQPLIRTLLYNDQVLDTGRIGAALDEKNAQADFNKLLTWASWMIGLALFLSAATNFALTLWLLPAQSGTEHFNAQLGKLQFWSWPVTMIPSGAISIYALVRLLKGVENLTGLSGEDLFQARPKKAEVKGPSTMAEPPE